MIGIHFLTVSSHCLCEVCGGRFPILMIRKLRVRITQAEKGGDRRELSPVWLQERSLPLLQGWAPDHLLCSIPWWNGGKRKGSFAFPSFFLPDAANLIIALYFPVELTKRSSLSAWFLLTFPRETHLALTTWLKGFGQTTYYYKLFIENQLLRRIDKCMLKSVSKFISH